jgi:type II secretory pathway pseudopilin PulG
VTVQSLRAKWRARAQRANSAELGFTVVEVIVVVVIMGVVMAPLTFGLFQALTYVPRARDVSASSVQRTTLNDRFGDDVAQATSIVAPSDTLDQPSTTSPATTLVPCQTSASGIPVTLARMHWNWAAANQYRRITYQVKFGSTVTNGLVPTTIVRLVEFVDGATVTPGTAEDLVSGYCHTADDAASATWTAVGDEGVRRERLLVTLRLRDSFQDVRTTPYRMLAVMRKTSN